MVKTVQNYINHIVLVLDESASMRIHASDLVKVADSQIAYLAQRSKELDQETRITVYTFNSRDTARCLVYDKDVLRVPSIAGLYDPRGMTALVDTTLLAIDDLALTPEKYGEHAFLIYVLTDGQENSSRHHGGVLAQRINGLPDHWTLATFVPDQRSVFEVKRFGFPAANIAVWDATSFGGVIEVGETIRQTSDSFMVNRTKGIRGSRNLFTVNTVPVNDVKRSLIPLTEGSYYIKDVFYDTRIDEFTGKGYVPGKTYYQLTKRETIQPHKAIAILADGRVYSGQNARDLLGLPKKNVRVSPDDHADYTIFVQSTSYNRKLIAGTRTLVLR